MSIPRSTALIVPIRLFCEIYFYRNYSQQWYFFFATTFLIEMLDVNKQWDWRQKWLYALEQICITRVKCVKMVIGMPICQSWIDFGLRDSANCTPTKYYPEWFSWPASHKGCLCLLHVAVARMKKRRFLWYTYTPNSNDENEEDEKLHRMKN